MTRAQVEEMLVPEAFHSFLLTTGSLAIVVHKAADVVLLGADTLAIRPQEGPSFQIPVSAICSIDPIFE